MSARALVVARSLRLLTIGIGPLSHSELERPAYEKVKEDENLKKAVAEGAKQASKAAAGGLSPIAAKYP